MFENCSVFVIVRENKEERVCKLETDASAQTDINTCLNTTAEAIKQKHRVDFTGSYTPLEDEALEIQNFILADEIKDALRNPLSLDSFQPTVDNLQNIKAVFIGYCGEDGQKEVFVAAFQRFRKEQFFSVGKICLFFDENTFSRDKRTGIAISDSVDCLCIGDSLIFTSYYYARQVFDLSGYYRSATDTDVAEFTEVDKLCFQDCEAFKSGANTWVRRKIALIKDSGVLEKFSAKDIKKRAKASNIEIEVSDGKIVIPTDNTKLKIVLSFLDEEAYEGPFTHNTYLSNSKRKV